MGQQQSLQIYGVTPLHFSNIEETKKILAATPKEGLLEAITSKYQSEDKNAPIHTADAEKTKLLMQALSPEERTIAAKTTNAIGYTPLHRASVEKTKAIMDSIPENERLPFTQELIKIKGNLPIIEPTVLDTGDTQQAQIYSKILPTGTNIINSLHKENVNNEGYKDQITTPNQVAQLFLGTSDRSEKLQRDFEDNLPKYMSYAVDIMNAPEQSQKLSHKEKDVLTIVGHAKDTSNVFSKAKDLSDSLKSVPEDIEKNLSELDNTGEIKNFTLNVDRAAKIRDEVTAQEGIENKRRTFVESLRQQNLEPSR